MPTYVYKAKNGPSETVEGELEADSRNIAVSRIDAMGYHPVWVKEKEAAKGSASKRLLGLRISGRDITVFTSQLASLTRSGVPILRSLTTIANQTENASLQRVVQDLQITIRDGEMLSDALSKYPRLFNELYVNMVKSGESGGVLDVILTRLTEAREREEDTRRRVQAAMAYPVLIVSAGLATVFALFAFFLPRVVALFENYTDLPLPTMILIEVSDFFSEKWYWILLVILLVAAVLKRLAALENGRLFFDRIKLSIPLVSRFIRESDIARFARTLGLLLDTGSPIDRALALSSDTLRNSVLKEEVGAARDSTVRQGLQLSIGLHQAKHFPPFVANLVAVGEEGGKLPEALTELATFYEKQVEQQSRMVTSLIEPLLILVVGALVGFIVAAMLLPIFELGGAIR